MTDIELKPMAYIRALRESGMHSTTRHVLSVLASYGDSDGTRIYPGTRALAEATGYSNRTVITHLNLGREEGWITWTERKMGRDWRGRDYQLCLPELLQGGEGASPRQTQGGEPNDIEVVKEVHRTENTIPEHKLLTPSGAASPAGKMITVLTDNGPIEVEREWGGAASRLIYEWLSRYAGLIPGSMPSDCPWDGEMALAKRVWIATGPVDLYAALRGASLRAEAGILPGVSRGESFSLVKKVFPVDNPEEYQLNLKAGRIVPEVPPELMHTLMATFADPESTHREEVRVV